MVKNLVCVIVLTGLVGVACGPDKGEPERSLSFWVYAGSNIVIFRGFPDDEASLLASGAMEHFEDVSDLVLGQAQVSLLADGTEVAAADCEAVFMEVPVGEIGRADFGIECAFTNASVDALCEAGQAGIQILVRSNLADYQGPVEDLDVQCFADRHMPEIMELVSQGNPADKPCKADYDGIEDRFGYQDGWILFSDEYQDDVFMGRRAFYHNADGTMSHTVSVDADGWWFRKRSYEYTDGVLVSVTTENYPEAPYTCTYTFENGDSSWTVNCDGDTSTTQWDPVAKTLVRDIDGVEFTLTYSGSLISPTQWHGEFWVDYINAMHPLDDSGVRNNQAISTNYTYNAFERLIEATSYVDGQAFGTVTYEYDCP